MTSIRYAVLTLLFTSIMLQGFPAMSKVVGGGTIRFRGEIIDDSKLKSKEDYYDIRFEPHVDKDFPYRVYSKLTGHFMSGHAEKAIAEQQAHNFPNSAYYR